MLKKLFNTGISLLLIFIFLNPVHAQVPMFTLNLLDSSKRSEKFAERKLGSEKMAEKKFNLYRHVVQNNFTHYNYYFNANNKLNAVLERAKAAQNDDYSKLLSYYPYTIANTASQKTELDSVIYKATAGILLHDLRNDWIDNMYLLMGRAYFLRGEFDSAASTFQFINYNLFPRKKHEDDSRVVGTTDAASKSTISIASKEKQNILQKVTAKPPSRNDALIMMALTLIEQNEMGDAAGLITTLKNDPNLPKRLTDDLADINAYFFYKQNMYDSAAVYLEKALTNADNKQDKARSEFLLAQLYELNKQYDKASIYYNTASSHTTNALMDIHAQLNNAKMMRGNNNKELDKGIDNLDHLSKKDKFENYRDIIHFSSGVLAMQKPDTNQAIAYFKKSLKYNESNIIYKNKAFLELAEIAYHRKEYKAAFSYYDSLQSGDTTLKDRLQEIQSRRNALSKIVEKIIVIEREDSLQKIAAMDPAAREAFVKKMSRRLRKERGLKEEDNSVDAAGMIGFASDKDKPTDLFATSNSSSGDWYFYNSGLKSKGFSDFKRKWGVRTNSDNWRRKSAGGNAIATSQDTQDNVTAPPAAMFSGNPDDLDAAPPAADTKTKDNPKGKGSVKGQGKDQGKTNEPAQPEDISFEGLMGNLPLTKEKLDVSTALLATNLFELANLYKDELEDYQEAIITYDSSLKRFPDSLYNGQIYLGLYYCYTKLGNTGKAAYYKNLLNTNFAGTHAAQLLTKTGAAKPNEKNAEGTKRYEAIYNLFIEGKFEAAVAEKKNADSVYGKNYWSPQLLYIESVYHVKQKDDSTATKVLQDIVSLYPGSPLKPRAEKMIEVLKRRKEIETYLTNLQVTRLKEDEVAYVEEKVRLIRNDSNLIKSPKLFDSSKAEIKSISNIPKIADTLVKAARVISGPYIFDENTTQNVVILLDKVDGTYVNETKNAFTRYAGDNFRGIPITVTRDAVDKDISMVVFAEFATADAAFQFLLKVRKAAPEEISWLPASKYSFILIDNDNIQRLKNSKDIAGYKAILNKKYPGQFK